MLYLFELNGLELTCTSNGYLLVLYEFITTPSLRRIAIAIHLRRFSVHFDFGKPGGQIRVKSALSHI
jgi:hypothetical protein